MANLDDMQRKIEGLLRKAERAGSPEEAEAFSAKAEALMLKYSIDHMMLGNKEERSDDPIIRVVEIKGIYALCSTQGLHGIVKALGTCEYWITGKAAKSHNGMVCGFESDVDQAIMLWNSLALQAANAMQHWAANRDLSGMSAFEKFQERRTFLQGFWMRAARRVREAFEEVLNEAEVEYHGGAALALVDRKEKVKALMPQGMRSQKDRTKMGSYGALVAGQDAAERADLGQKRVTENRRKLTK